MHGVVLLLVDDSDVDRYISRRLFTRASKDLQIMELADGAEALAYLRNTNVPDGLTLLIMLDLNMPVMNGFEFLQAFGELRESRPDLERCIINVLTSSNHPDDLHRAMQFPFVNRHYVKMPNESEIDELVQLASSR